MSQLAQDLNNAIHGTDPYAGFAWQEYPDDMTGGNEHASMQSVFDAVKPTFVIEVGSWKGKSAIKMADILTMQGNKDFAILCIDTWLGSIEHMLNGMSSIWQIRPEDRLFGHPTLYYQFMANVCRRSYDKNIVPFPCTSLTGSKWMQRQLVKPELIYIDGDHDEDEVYADLKRWWPILDMGGAMIGDDFDITWPGVICATSRFAREVGANLLHTNDNLWLIQKTA